MRTPPGYQDDQGIGWFLLYIGGAVPLGLGLLSDRQWIGLVLITYFWWPTWWQHARGDYRNRPPAVRRR